MSTTKYEKKNKYRQRKMAEKKKIQQQKVDYDKRYGSSRKYRKQCAIAHKSTHGLCCVCMVKKSDEIHHAYYGKDAIGESTFPVCLSCHQSICHSPKNWIKDGSNPLWKNRNTSEFLQRLRLGYQLLYEGINLI